MHAPLTRAMIEAAARTPEVRNAPDLTVQQLAQTAVLLSPPRPGLVETAALSCLCPDFDAHVQGAQPIPAPRAHALS